MRRPVLSAIEILLVLGIAVGMGSILLSAIVMGYR